MAELQHFNAKVCHTVAGILIHEQKTLLVKHKKLGIWLCPGGHVEEEELPHKAAEREFWEETGVEVRATNTLLQDSADDSEYLPHPILTNLHWISQENYQRRLESTNTDQRHSTDKWKLGCEQHYCFIYMMESVNGVEFSQNVEETDGISWFTEAEIDHLETTPDIKSQLHYAFSLT